MKKFMALLAAGFLALSFVGCSGDSDSSSSSSSNSGQTTTTGTATFTGAGFGGTIKIDYNADGTYLMTWTTGSYSTNKGKGTYTLTGTFDNGTIHQHQTHSSNTLNTGWVEEVEDNELVVTNGTFQAVGSTFTKTK